MRNFRQTLKSLFANIAPRFHGLSVAHNNVMASSTSPVFSEHALDRCLFDFTLPVNQLIYAHFELSAQLNLHMNGAH